MFEESRNRKLGGVLTLCENLILVRKLSQAFFNSQGDDKIGWFHFSNGLCFLGF